MKKTWIAAVSIVAGFALAARADVRRTETDVDLPPYAPCVEDDGRPAVATVVAITGDATTASPGCGPRPLGCGSVVRAGDRIVTGAGSQAAFALGDRYVQVGSDANVVANGGPDESGADLAVGAGTVRVISTSDAPLPTRVATPQLETSTPGRDTVAVVGSDGRGSAICSYAEPIEVRSTAGGPLARTGTATTGGAASDCVRAGVGADPGSTATPTGTTAALAVAAPSIAEVGACDVAGLFDPFDVAAGPPGLGFDFPPPVPPPPPICQVGACSGGNPPPNKGHAGVPLVEPPAGYEPPP